LNAELNTLKAMMGNTIAFFCLGESSTDSHAPQMLDNLPTRSRDIILANTKQLASLALRILKSLHPRADLDVAGEGFAATYINEEALKLIEDSAVMAGHIIDMLAIDLPLG
jgi:hypothetical protein